MAQESIYNLLPREEEQAAATARYQSKYSSMVREEYQQTKDFARTMGPLKVDTGSPTNYLKKGTGRLSPKKHTEEQNHSPTKPHTKPPVPKHDELATLPEPSNKNFLHENTMDVLRTVPKKPEPAILDRTRGPGGRQLLEQSGLVPKYSKAETFGKVPDYLTQRKQEEAHVQRDREAQYEAMSKVGAPRQLSEDERQKMLEGLKANWTQLHRDYQGLPVVLDTESKKQRKKRLEEKLAQLEADIQRIESHPVIYVEQ